ncbi:MAG: hypothetical protein KatS3mg019_0573 [Fimbriimonadales bacterium]|nr:MAG: hypothetical protein KatS3mg019_0573 [Fimbriimonadales bacterium]
MRVYNRAIGGASWNTLEEYVETPTVRWYGTGAETYRAYTMVAGYLISDQTASQIDFAYFDAFEEILNLPTVRMPEELSTDFVTASLSRRIRDFICRFLPFFCRGTRKPNPRDPVYEGCLAICNTYAQYCRGLPASFICGRIAQLGCEKMCRDIKEAKYFTDCWTSCKSLHTDAQCMDCCLETCRNHGAGSQKKCENVCYTDVLPERGWRPQ